MIWIGMFVGSIIGGWIPTLWGAGFLSMASLFFSTVGAIVGLVIAYKLSNY